MLNNKEDKGIGEEEKEEVTEPLAKEVNFLDLIGKIKTTTTIPTYIPKILSQQVVIYIDDLTTPTVKRLYVYADKANIWNYVTLT